MNSVCEGSESPDRRTDSKTKESKRRRRSNEEEQGSGAEEQEETRPDREFEIQASENGEFSNEGRSSSCNSSQKTLIESTEEETGVNETNQELYTVTEVPEDEESHDTEVNFRTSVRDRNSEGKQKKMMEEIGAFFNDAKKLDRVWNLVKAINASDQSEKQKQARSEANQAGEENITDVSNKGSRVGIDATRLVSNKTSTTVYEQASEGNNRQNSSSEDLNSSDFTSSDDATSPIEFSEGRARGKVPVRLPLPPPLPPKRNEDQPGTSTGGWTGGSERVRRTKEASREVQEEASALRIHPVKPAGKSVELRTNDIDQLLGEIRNKGSDLSVLADSLNALSTEGEFDPLTVQLDNGTIEKIGRGAYVDLRRLIPRESIGDDVDEDDLHWVIQDGTPKLKKKSGSELLSVNEFRSWMTAFSAYSRIYTKANPAWGPETHQYILDIQEATVTYTWDSIYAYDKIFRMYMEKKPGHDWGTPYAKYWNKVLKRKDHREQGGNRGQGGFYPGNRQQRKTCWKYNKFGRCDRGKDCEFEH